ncbi:toll/interleukin-1 receptor domain-containing protein [Candidatus Thalassolituus haligoni]|uniref:toll/interleukin-1 receptor domain-containing protein n=1 Tax=Candidatus Thalassolituus haligoni TaxID=3100113 RepID=UPI003518E99A
MDFVTQFFISHASEDKEEFVRPFANTLIDTGVDVWYDEYSLKIGDSLAESIDSGLRECDFCIVVLSHAFFAKKWTKKELYSLENRQINENRKIVLPVWHNVTSNEVATFSPFLGDTIALTSDIEMRKLTNQILESVADESEYLSTKKRYIDALNRLDYYLERDGLIDPDDSLFWRFDFEKEISSTKFIIKRCEDKLDKFERKSPNKSMQSD